MAEKTVAVRLAVNDANRAIAALKSFGAEGEAALDRITTAAPRASAAMGGLASRGAMFQQLGYQVGDFAVQVQGGTSALTAFIQQGSQIAGVFGPVGAAVGAVGAIVGGLAGYFLRSSEAADTNAAALRKLREDTDEYKASLEALRPLEIARLENLVASAAAEKKAAENFFAPDQARARQKEQSNPFSVPGANPSTRPLLEDNQPLLDRIKVENENALRLKQAQLDYDNRNLAEIIGKNDLTRPGEQARDYYVAEQAELKKLATEQKALLERRDQLIAKTKLEAETSAKLADATALGADAVRKVQIEQASELRILDASRILKGKDLAAYKALSAAIAENEKRVLALNAAKAHGGNQSPAGLRNQAERESIVKLGDYQREQVREQVADQQRVAERASDDMREILIQPWKDLTAETSRLATSIFDDYLAKGKVSGKQLADSAGTFLRQTIAGTAGSLVTAPLNSAISQIGAEAVKPGGDIGSSLTQFGADHPYLASAGLGAAGGYAAGSIYAQVTGKEDTYAATGGAVGGAAGALAGAYIGTAVFPGLGTAGGAAIGGILGSTIGSLGGGLFGGGENLGNDKSAQSYVTAKGKIGYSDSSFSQGNRSITGGILGQVGGLQESLQALGASIGDAVIRVEAGNKSGITVNGQRYATQEEALAGALKRLLGNTSGLGASEQTALRNSKGRSAQEVLGDLDFAKQFDRLTFTGGAAQRAMLDLNETFAAASRRAKALGLDTDELAKAQQRAQAEIVKATREQLTGQVRGIGDYFSSLIEPLKAVNQNQASPLSQIDASRKRFQETAGLARGGDLRATQELSGRAQELEGLRSQYLGSGGLGAEISREIARGVDPVRALLERQQAETLASLPKVQRETVAEQIKVMVTEASKTRDELVKIRKALADLKAAAA